MPTTGPTPVAELATAPTIQNVNVPSANTEVAIAIPAKTRKIQIKARGFLANLKFAFIVNQSNTVYVSIPQGCVFTDDGLDLNGTTLYLQSDKASQVVEVLSWARP